MTAIDPGTDHDIGAWPPLDASAFVAVAACPACGATAASPLGGPQNLVAGRRFPAGPRRFAAELRARRRLVRCDACGAVYQTLVPRPELLARLYAAADGDLKPWPPDARRRTWARALAALPAGGGRLLDVGANDGHFISRLPAGWRADALEATGVNLPALQVRAARVHVGFLDDPALELPAEAYDAVTMFDVAEHLRDVPTALAHVHRALKPGGLLLLETGDAGCPAARLLRGGWWYYDYIEHFTFFTATALARALRGAGFAVVSNRPVVHTALAADGRAHVARRWRERARVAARWLRRRSALGTAADPHGPWLLHPLRFWARDHRFAVARKVPST